MNNIPSVPDLSVEALVGQVADEFVQQLNRGEQPAIEDYARRHPEIDGVLRQVLAALQLVRMPAADDESAGPALNLSGLVRGCLGDYRIVREIGRGGMGVVYEAEQISLARRVALKVLPFAAALDAKQLQRFKNEAQAAAQLHHTNIVPVFGVGCERGVHYYAMQFIEGPTLAAVIRDLRQTEKPDFPAASPSSRLASSPGGDMTSDRPAQVAPRSAEFCASAGARDEAPAGAPPIAPATQPVVALTTERSTSSPVSIRTAANLGVQAAEALEHAHQLGVVHRDIKPANLLVDLRGNLWITDFGLAHCQSQAGLTLSGDLVGTLRYMSPEQALGQHGLVDHRTDVYSLGATLYELLTLQPACDGRDRQEVLRQIEREEPRLPRRLNPRIPADLETVVLKAIAKVPAERYATAKALADDLKRFLEDKPIQAKRPSLVHKLRKWSRRHQAVVVSTGTSVLVLLILALVALGVNNSQVRHEQMRTVTEKERAEASYRMAREAMEEIARSVWEDEQLKGGPFEHLRRKALEAELLFYQKFVELHGEEPDFQAERGRAYGQMGLMHRRFGREEEAEKVYHQAIEVFARLAANFPAVPSYRQGLAYCDNDLAELLDRMGRWSEAERHYKLALARHAQLAAENPAEPAYRRDLAKHQLNLGALYQSTGRLKEAEQALQEALALQKVLARDYPTVPDYQANLAGGYNTLAHLYQVTGRPKEAEQIYQDNLALIKLLARDHPSVPEYQVTLAIGCNDLALLYQATGQLKEAEQAYRDALPVQRILARDHPTIPEYQSLLAKGYNNLGILYQATGRLEEAEQAYRDALALQEVLVRDHPTVAVFAIALGGAQCNLGNLVQRSGRTEAALPWYAQAIATLEAVLAKVPQHVSAREFLRNSRWARAEALIRLGRHAEALQDLDRALVLDTGRACTALRLQRAATLAGMGDHARATAEADVLAEANDASSDTLYDAACLYARAAAAVREDSKLAERYAGRGMEWLRQAVAKGYQDVEHMKKDTDLDALHERADFRRLLTELEEKTKDKEVSGKKQ